MRFILAIVVAALLAAPISAQNRGRRSYNGPRPYVGYRTHHPYSHGPSAPYGFGPYAHIGPYGARGYGYYPGGVVDLGLATFLARQAQDARGDVLPLGWRAYDRYGYDGYDPRDVAPYGSYAPVAPRGDSSYRGEFGRDRGDGNPYVAPKAPIRIRESVEDGVPTLVSDN